MNTVSKEFESESEVLKKGFLDQGDTEHTRYVYRIGLSVRFGTKLDTATHDYTKCQTCLSIEEKLKSAATVSDFLDVDYMQREFVNALHKVWIHRSID